MNLLQRASPRKAPLTCAPALLPDEAHWFRKAIEHHVIDVGECRPDCPRRRRWNEATSDEFLTPTGQHRHLFSLSTSAPVRLNREYVPHIAAASRAILHFGFSRERFSLSLHRTFQRDCVNKRRGQSYETDAEFYAPDGSVQLHIEAKRTASAVRRIADAVERCGTFANLPESCQKELEYVLDVAPKFLWLVGPGCVDPEQYVYAVRVQGIRADFSRLDGLAATTGV